MIIKKIVSLTVVFCMLFTMFVCFDVSAKDKITVMVDDRELNFDVPPEVVNGRTMVPFRLIFEALGAKISYNASTSEVTAERLWNGNPEDAEAYKYITPAYVKLKIGSKKMETVIDKKLTTVSLDVAPYAKNGRTLVPVRAISESFGADVYWDADTQTVLIYSNNLFHTGSYMIGSNEKSSDMWRDDAYNFINGKLYFSFGKYQKVHRDSYETEYIWDGYHLYEGNFTSVKDVEGFDKLNNKLFYIRPGSYEKTSKGNISTEEYYTADYDGKNAELIARYKSESFWNNDGYTSDPSNDVITLTIKSRPECWGFLDDKDNVTSTLAKPGEYVYDLKKDDLEPFFLPMFTKGEYNNTHLFNKEAGAKISDARLIYSSAIDGTEKSVELPVPRLSNEYINIVLQTPRYIFVKALVYRTPKTYYNALFAMDRFEDKLTTIMTISADLDNEGFGSYGSDGNSSSSSPSSSGRTCSYCFGDGYKECSVCHGSGKVKKYTFYERTVSCPGCTGGKKRCVVCGGDGDSGN